MPKYTKEELLIKKEGSGLIVPDNLSEIAQIQLDYVSKSLPSTKSGSSSKANSTDKLSNRSSKHRNKKETVKDENGFITQSRQKNDWTSPTSPPSGNILDAKNEDGMDDIQRFKLKMKMEEKKKTDKHKPKNIFDILADDVDVDEVFASEDSHNSLNVKSNENPQQESKFSKFFSSSAKEESNKDYTKIVNMLASSLHKTEIAKPAVEEETNPIAAMLQNSIKGKKGVK